MPESFKKNEYGLMEVVLKVVKKDEAFVVAKRR